VAFIETEDSMKWVGDGYSQKVWSQALKINDLVKFDATRGEVPSESDDFSAVVITGSHYNISDQLPWMETLYEYIRLCASRPKVRVVAVCFGCQAVATALGGRVTPNPYGRFRVTREVLSIDNAAWSCIFDNDRLPSSAALLAAHGYLVAQRPEDSVLLATSGGSPNELFLAGKYNNIICCQAHPEFEPTMVVEKILPSLVSSNLISSDEAMATENLILNSSCSFDSDTFRRLFHDWLQGKIHTNTTNSSYY